MNDTNLTHAFEEAGLGVAPFAFVGCVDSGAGANADGMVKRTSAEGIEFWTKPGGSCAYCGIGIVILCKIQDANGARFHVGTSCAGKSGDKGIINLAKRAAGRISRAKAVAKQETRIEAVRVALGLEGLGTMALRHGDTLGVLAATDLFATLADRPHPLEYWADQGKTMATWVCWTLANAGHAGKFKATKIIEKILKEAN